MKNGRFAFMSPLWLKCYEQISVFARKGSVWPQMLNTRDHPPPIILRVGKPK